MNVSVLAVTILGTFGRTAVRPSALAYNPAVTFTLNQDTRTTRHESYSVSQRKRKRVEEIFGWLKTVGMIRKTRHRGLPRVDWIFTFALAAYNLVRIRNLVLAAA